jgi:hypothetical protein
MFQIVTTVPSEKPSSTGMLSASSLDPTGPGFQLCSENTAVTGTVGYKSNPRESSVNVPLEQSLANIIDCFDIFEGEENTQASHRDLVESWSFEVDVFDFSGVEYDLLGVYFWNYFGEQFDVDQIDFQFFNLQDEVVANYL